MTENKIYAHVKREGDDNTYIALVSGPFTGVVYDYGNISIQELPDSDQAKLKFHYDIVSSAHYSEDELSSPEFIDILGDILVDLLDDPETKVLTNESNDRTDDT